MKSAFIITAPHSGCGKTTFAVSIVRALVKRDKKVQTYKVGPDYIDTSLLSKACGKDTYNLDRVLMKEEDIKKYFFKGLMQNDIAVVEGVMGLFDSYDTINFIGSSAHISKMLNLPILLLINYVPSLTYFTALIKGIEMLMKNYDCKIGVIINKAKNLKDERISQSLAHHTGAKLLGVIPEDNRLFIQKRHLGLINDDENFEDHLDAMAEFIEDNIVLEELLNFFIYDIDINSASLDFKCQPRSKDLSFKSSSKICLIARDKAFSFYYKNNLDILEEEGYSLQYFSPLSNEPVKEAHFIYIGGGYPELYAHLLSKSFETKETLIKAVKEGLPILAECGGFIYLSKSLWIDSQNFPMGGIFDVDIEFCNTLQRLGYVKISINDPRFSEKTYIGHQFRYSKIRQNREPLICKVKLLGKAESFHDGCLQRRCFGSFTHFNFSGAKIFRDLKGENYE